MTPTHVILIILAGRCSSRTRGPSLARETTTWRSDESSSFPRVALIWPADDPHGSWISARGHGDRPPFFQGECRRIAHQVRRHGRGLRPPRPEIHRPAVFLGAAKRGGLSHGPERRE